MLDFSVNRTMATGLLACQTAPNGLDGATDDITTFSALVVVGDLELALTTYWDPRLS